MYRNVDVSREDYLKLLDKVYFFINILTKFTQFDFSQT
jgi:hypothetical protein